MVHWAGADGLDLPDPEVGDRTQLYNLYAFWLRFAEHRKWLPKQEAASGVSPGPKKK